MSCIQQDTGDTVSLLPRLMIWCWCFAQWHVGIDDFAAVDESVMGIGKVFTETSHVALYGQLPLG